MDNPVTTGPKRRVSILDLTRQHAPLQEALDAALARVTAAHAYILGDDVRLLEQELAAYTNARHAIGCASGSDALILALLALGVRHGDRVLTSPFSFFASAGSISRVGAVPVFADIDPATFNLDPAAVSDVLRHVPRVKAIIPVHLYGGSADLDLLLAIARQRGCAVVEDGAQSLGATCRGRHTLTLGTIGCTSFYPTKNLGALGDAGMVFTNDDGLADRLRALRVHGGTRRYYHDYLGMNSRLDTLQAAALRVKLPYLTEWNARRAALAAMYTGLLAGAPVLCPQPAAYQTHHVWHQYVIRCSRRDELRAYLAQQEIAAEIYYPLPLHLQQCYADLGYQPGDFPEAERAANEVLALPIHPALADDDIAYVAGHVLAFYR